jgi:hypothetical protein
MHRVLHPQAERRSAALTDPNQDILGMLGASLNVAEDGIQFNVFKRTRPSMQEIEIREYAQQLLERYGDKAIVIAANKAKVFAEKGDSKESATWRHIEAALKLVRGPNQS